MGRIAVGVVEHWLPLPPATCAPPMLQPARPPTRPPTPPTLPAADSRTACEASPYVESLTRRGYEVLYLTEPIDEVAVQNLQVCVWGAECAWGEVCGAECVRCTAQGSVCCAVSGAAACHFNSTRPPFSQLLVLSPLTLVLLVLPAPLFYRSLMAWPWRM